MDTVVRIVCTAGERGMGDSRLRVCVVGGGFQRGPPRIAPPHTSPLRSVHWRGRGREDFRATSRRRHPHVRLVCLAGGVVVRGSASPLLPMHLWPVRDVGPPPPPLAPQPHRRDGRAGRAHGGRHAGHDRQACGVKRAAWGAPCTHREMPRCPLRARRHRCGVIVWLEVIGAAAACDAPARCAPRTSGVSGCKLPCHLPHTLDAHRTAL